MKAIKYIFSIALLTAVVSLNAQSFKGVVLLADKPVKGAVITDSNSNIIAKTNSNGEFTLEQSISKAVVSYKNTSKEHSFETLAFSTIVLVPSEKQLLKMIAKEPSINKCSLFLEAYPQSASISEVTAQKEELTFIAAYDNAVTTYNVDGLDAYLLSYPNGTYANKATQTMEVISWQYARLQDTPQSYNDFLAKYPDSKTATEAVARIENKE